MDIPSILLRPRDDEDDEDAPEILDKVKLKLFKADPARISPFGYSVISWEVEGPLGFQVLLLHQSVTKKGQKIVNPSTSTTYRLYARARGLTKELGRLEVAVDNQGCETIRLEDRVRLKPTLEGVVRYTIEEIPDIYFRSIYLPDSNETQFIYPVFNFSPWKIDFTLKLKARVDDWPDPNVDVHASFGLTVIDGVLVPINDDINVSITFPFWVWGIPGAQFALIMAIADGERETRTQIKNAIYGGIAQFFNAFARPSEGKRLRTVQQIDKGDGEGSVIVMACPFDLLMKYSKISESKEVIK
jgi:hypothetical protein